MSASPEITPVRPADDFVTVLSEWLAFRAGTDELLARLQGIDPSGLEAEPTDAVRELLEQLAWPSPNGRGHLERLVRDAVAMA